MPDRISDHDQLRALLQRYARAADTRNLEELRDLFEPDAIIDGARGKLSLDRWLEAMAAPATSNVSMHFLGEPLIEMEDDAVANVDTYAVVYLGEKGPTLGMRYLDVAARSSGVWRIRHRVARTVWTR